MFVFDTNSQLLNSLQETIHECWDSDPEARLPAANVSHRLEDLLNTTVNFFEDVPGASNVHGTTHQHTTTTVTMYNDNVTTVDIRRPTEHSQSSPPPYYSPLDPFSDHPVPYHIPDPGLIQNQRPQRPYFQSSMPHIMQSDQERLHDASGVDYELTPRCSRSLRSSRVVERQGFQLNEYNSLKTLPVRNSLVLCMEERETSLGQLVDTPGLESESSVSSLSNESLEEEEASDSGVNSALHVIHVRDDDLSYDQRLAVESLLSNGSEQDSNLNSDSGIQNLHSASTHTSSSECDDLSEHNNFPHNSSDVSTDTISNNNIVLTDCGVNPVISSSSERSISASALLPVETSGNSSITVTSV